MSEYPTGSAEGMEPAGKTKLRVEKRGSPRKPTRAAFTVRLEATSLFGAGKNISARGAYLVTSDPIAVEISWNDEHGDREVTGRVVRIERLASESLGIALQFDNDVEV